MPLKINCPNCRKTLQVPDAAVGKRAKCPACQQVLQISGPPLAESPAAPTPAAPTLVAGSRSSKWFEEGMQPSASVASNVASAPHGIEGLWRDGGKLVVAVRGSSFPPVCAKTGEPISEKATRVELTWTPNQALWSIMFGVIGHFIATKNIGKKLTLDVPLASQWLEHRRMKRLLGWATLTGGIVWLILGIVGNVMALTMGVPEARTYWMLPAALLGLPISLGGAIFLMIGAGPPLIIRKMTDQYAWLAGANVKFLERLPLWDRE